MFWSIWCHSVMNGNRLRVLGYDEGLRWNYGGAYCSLNTAVIYKLKCPVYLSIPFKNSMLPSGNPYRMEIKQRQSSAEYCILSEIHVYDRDRLVRCGIATQCDSEDLLSCRSNDANFCWDSCLNTNQSLRQVIFWADDALANVAAKLL